MFGLMDAACCLGYLASGVPALVKYDNLKPAVIRVLKGRDQAAPGRGCRHSRR
jgi:hypothetical protein